MLSLKSFRDYCICFIFIYSNDFLPIQLDNINYKLEKAVKKMP